MRHDLREFLEHHIRWAEILLNGHAATPTERAYHRGRLNALRQVLKALTRALMKIEEQVLRMDKPDPLVAVLAELERAAMHLLADHDCDTDGHENILRAAQSAAKIRAALTESTIEARRDALESIEKPAHQKRLLGTWKGHAVYVDEAAPAAVAAEIYRALGEAGDKWLEGKL